MTTGINKACSVCGGPVFSNNRVVICQRSLACKAARGRAVRAARRAMRGPRPRCRVCGGPLRSDNRIGICNVTQKCVTARVMAKYNAERGPKPLCLACGLPLKTRKGTAHPECKKQARPVLLRRLAIGLELLEAQRAAEAEAKREVQTGEREAKRRTWEQYEQERRERVNETVVDAAKRWREQYEAGRRARGIPVEGLPVIAGNSAVA